MTITEKVSYLKGLCEGIGISDETNEGRIFKAMIDILDDMALTISDMEDGFAEVCEQVDAIDEDLGTLEEDFYGEEECDCGCEDEDDFDEEELYEVTCPSCGESICIDEEMLDIGQMECPSCGEHLEFDIDDVEDDECDCGCCGEDQE
ncbi:CD1247 N-terminal domain-containing protein [Zongyangia hominis]|uniref:TFIIB-type domain-containing protein n=1 Tax=Zongyangia hominis TaxID=2763677 RepID=A0A926EAE2_9FIRM|nr:CD1247 N-terminal domain-containing protein [Zongyangia hominis]MBC8569365.1 hypothetical protein [Zongyangia hominis]